MSDEEYTHIVIGSRADRLPHVPSMRRPCRECGHDTWVSVSTARALDEYEVECMECVPPEALDEAKVSPETLREVMQWAAQQEGPHRG